MEVTFLGSGDAFGSGGRFNTCFLVRHALGAFLIDCGASSLVAMRKFGVDPNDIGAIFISHLHGDTHMGPDMLAHLDDVSEDAAEDGKTVTV